MSEQLVFPVAKRAEFATWLRNLADDIEAGNVKPVRVSEWRKVEHADLSERSDYVAGGIKKYRVKRDTPNLHGATIEWKQAK